MRSRYANPNKLLGPQQTQDPTFFPERSERHTALSGVEQLLLDRVKSNFVELMEDPRFDESIRPGNQVIERLV